MLWMHLPNIEVSLCIVLLVACCTGSTRGHTKVFFAIADTMLT